MTRYLRLIAVVICLSCSVQTKAQFDLENIDLNDIIGKVMKVEKGFSPKFFLGKQPLEKISKVAEVLGLKKNEKINKLFGTFRTGRTIWKIASYGGSAILIYGLAKRLDKAASEGDYNGALVSGLTTVAGGLAVKFLTKGASYKAVDLFNGIAVKKIKDIFKIGAATEGVGVGVFVKL
jgi:hypothetical protein